MTYKKKITMLRNAFTWGVCYSHANAILFTPDYKMTDADGEHAIGKWRLQLSEKGRHQKTDFTSKKQALDHYSNLLKCAHNVDTEIVLETEREPLLNKA